MRVIKLQSDAVATFDKLVEHFVANDDDGGADVFQKWIDTHANEPGWGFAALIEVAVSKVAFLREQLLEASRND